MDKELENIQKIKALFLNKVQGLNWYYFQLDFSKYRDFKPHSPAEIETFLENVRLDIVSEKFKYFGEPVTVDEIFPVVLSYIKLNPEVIGIVTKRIFDMKDNEIPDESEAYKTPIGKFNESDRVYRNKKYLKRMKTFQRGKNHFVVLAEGDSWFEFPKMYAGLRFLGVDLVKDIVDWLIADDKYVVYSLAAGADWLSNMMYQGEYVKELPKVSPDVFLISGGGNDLVGNHRLATMVRNPFLVGKLDLANPIANSPLKILLDKRKGNSEIDLSTYQLGISLIADDFYNFLNVCLTQYFLFFFNINSSPEYEQMIFITQGYDFAIPTPVRHGNWFFAQHYENMAINSGKWLFEALQMKGITDPKEQRAVVYACIYEFNEMLILMSNYFANVYHVDNRGVASAPNAWYDELHLKSEYFQKVAEAYKKCIIDNARNPQGKKIYKTRNAPNY